MADNVTKRHVRVIFLHSRPFVATEQNIRRLATLGSPTVLLAALGGLALILLATGVLRSATPMSLVIE